MLGTRCLREYRDEEFVLDDAIMKYVSLLLIPLMLAATSNNAIARRTDANEPAQFSDHLVAWEKHQEMESRSPFHGLQWRSIGPVVQGGRVVDVATVPGQPYTFYVAYASGGVWKTSNNGVTFDPLFDHMPTMVIGDIEVDPNHPETIWVGTGEPQSSRSSYGGMGIYRSTDGGHTWQHMGLGDTNRIAKVHIDPANSQRIFVAALGKLYSPGGQRGLYLSEDGGESWSQVLAGDERTGIIDLVQHPTEQNILYAASWERERTAWNFVEGGTGSGIWRSDDGGLNWQRLSGGFPQGQYIGRIGLAVSADSPDTLYAVVDNQEPLPEEAWELGGHPLSPKRLRTMTEEEFLGQDMDVIEEFIRRNDIHPDMDAAKLTQMLKDDELSLEQLRDSLSNANANLFNADIKGMELYRSDDRGNHWYRTHEEAIGQVVYSYGYYFGQVRAAPDNVNRVYLLGVPLITSDDGGKTFTGLNDPKVHVDHHSLWIDPNNSQRIMLGNDGGLDVSYDGGQSWLKLDAQPVGQFYTIQVDMEQPYNVYGGLQDNGTYKGSSRNRWQDGPSWSHINGGDGMYVAVDPRDSSTVYTGYQFGNYVRLGKGGRSTVRPRNRLLEEPLRYNWNTPVILSPHHADVVYFGANKLFRSMDQGSSWTALSEDLSSSKERGDVPFATITTLSESKHAFGLIWAGTDDGEIWLTENGGQSWQDVDDRLPAQRWVSRVEASQHLRERAYISLNGYRNDDIRAYVYRTDDLGKKWVDISKGLPAEPVNVIREDPVNENLVYVGTDRGVYISMDRGANWQAFDSQLPNVPVHDLVIHPRERELVAGTHGRSAWVVDVLPLQELTNEVQEKAVHVFHVGDISAQRSWRSRRSPWFYDEERNEPVTIHYWSQESGDGQLEILDDKQRIVRRIPITAKAGINQASWDHLVDKAMALAVEQENNADKDDVTAKDQPYQQAVDLDYPLYVLPGDYELRVNINDESATGKVTVKAPSPYPSRAKAKAKLRGRKAS